LVRQGKLHLFTTSMRVQDLLLKDFCSIERLSSWMNQHMEVHGGLPVLKSTYWTVPF